MADFACLAGEGPCERADPDGSVGGLDASVADASVAAADAAGAEVSVVCGDGRLSPPETCDDGNRVVEACMAGELECTVCGAECTLVPGEVVEPSCTDGDSRRAACGPGDVGEVLSLCVAGDWVESSECSEIAALGALSCTANGAAGHVGLATVPASAGVLDVATARAACEALCMRYADLCIGVETDMNATDDGPGCTVFTDLPTLAAAGVDSIGPNTALTVRGTAFTVTCADDNCPTAALSGFSTSAIAGRYCSLLDAVETCTDTVVPRAGPVSCGINAEGSFLQTCTDDRWTTTTTCSRTDVCRNGKTTQAPCEAEGGTEVSVCAAGEWADAICYPYRFRSAEEGTCLVGPEHNALGLGYALASDEGEEDCLARCLLHSGWCYAAEIREDAESVTRCILVTDESTYETATGDAFAPTPAASKTIGDVIYTVECGSDACESTAWQDVALGPLTDSRCRVLERPEQCSADGSTQESETTCGLNSEGKMLETCVAGFWTDTEDCSGTDVCANGTTESQACGPSGGRSVATCTDGVWVPGSCLVFDRLSESSCLQAAGHSPLALLLEEVSEIEACETRCTAHSTWCRAAEIIPAGQFSVSPLCALLTDEATVETATGESLAPVLFAEVTVDGATFGIGCMNDCGSTSWGGGLSRSQEGGTCSVMGTLETCTTDAADRIGATVCGLNDEGFYSEVCTSGYWVQTETCSGTDVCENDTAGLRACDPEAEPDVERAACVEGQLSESSCVALNRWTVLEDSQCLSSADHDAVGFASAFSNVETAVDDCQAFCLGNSWCRGLTVHEVPEGLNCVLLTDEGLYETATSEELEFGGLSSVIVDGRPFAVNCSVDPCVDTSWGDGGSTAAAGSTCYLLDAE